MSTVVEVLESLGPDIVAVADTLRRAGIRGRRHDAFCCPVALYVAAGLGCPDNDNDHIAVGTDEVLVDDDEIELPDHVVDFVTAFDNGSYPDLEAPKEES